MAICGRRRSPPLVVDARHDAVGAVGGFPGYLGSLFAAMATAREEHFVEHGEQHDPDDVGDGQARRDGKGLVGEDTGYPAHEDQRKEDGHGGQRAAQKGRDHLRRAFVAGVRRTEAGLAAARDVFGHDDGVVDHHADGEDKPREGYDVERDVEKVEEKEGQHEGGDDRDAYDERGPQVAEEEGGQQKDEYQAEYKVLHEVGYGVVEEFGPVAGDGEGDFGIFALHPLYHLRQGLLQLVDVLLVLLDDGEGDGAFAPIFGDAVGFALHELHPRDVAEPDQALSVAYVDVGHVFGGAQPVGDADVVFVVALPDGHAARSDVGCGECALYHGAGDAGGFCLLRVGHYPQHPFRNAYVTSTMATSGSCSRRWRTELSATRASSRKLSLALPSALRHG